MEKGAIELRNPNSQRSPCSLRRLKKRTSVSVYPRILIQTLSRESENSTVRGQAKQVSHIGNSQTHRHRLNALSWVIVGGPAPYFECSRETAPSFHVPAPKISGMKLPRTGASQATSLVEEGLKHRVKREPRRPDLKQLRTAF